MIRPPRLVYVIDDDLSMRKAVGRLLESEHYSVEIFPGAREFLARVPHAGPSCVILDLNMPGLSGLQLQDTLAEMGRLEQVIFITGGASVPTCVQAMKAGAVDYLQKPFRDEELLSCVERALQRSSELWLQRLQRRDVRDRLATLTPRELDVLKGVIAGMLNKQIAAQFGTTEGTVKVHRGRVMEKMGATSVAELVILAQRAGIAPTASPQEPRAGGSNAGVAG
jgi:FixJ family two-component response regulator